MDLLEEVEQFVMIIRAQWQRRWWRRLLLRVGLLEEVEQFVLMAQWQRRWWRRMDLLAEVEQFVLRARWAEGSLGWHRAPLVEQIWSRKLARR